MLRGLFHADPHRGNIFRWDVDGRLSLLDWGLTGSMPLKQRSALVRLNGAVQRRDARAVVQVIEKLAGSSVAPQALRRVVGEHMQTALVLK